MQMLEYRSQPVSASVHTIPPSQYPPRVPSEIESKQSEVRMTVLLVINEHTYGRTIQYTLVVLFLV